MLCRSDSFISIVSSSNHIACHQPDVESCDEVELDIDALQHDQSIELLDGSILTLTARDEYSAVFKVPNMGRQCG